MFFKEKDDNGRLGGTMSFENIKIAHCAQIKAAEPTSPSDDDICMVL